MTIRQKPDAPKIKRHLSDLKNAEWLGSARRWWPDYLFHFTDVQNAVSIPKEGAVFSRKESLNQGLMLVDNASQDIIDQTDDKWKDYVRLYFRPRTPTQYRNEGFRPPDQREFGAHCPMPVYFLFDSYAILARSDSLFTNGSLASSTPEIYRNAVELDRVPFEHVYHDFPVTPEERATIVFHRHAEVVVPKQLELSSLRSIVCRSQAEYETFLHLLPPSARTRWEGKIGLGNRMNLFFKRWAYVNTVELDSSRITFHFKRFPPHQWLLCR